MTSDSQNLKLSHSRDILWSMLLIFLAAIPWIIISFFPHFLDARFMEAGFCQSKKNLQGYDSFEICFWFDLIGSVLLFLIIKSIGEGITPSDRKQLISAIPGTILHGCVHYYQFLMGGKFFHGEDGLKLSSLGEDPWYVYIGYLIFVFGFQFNLQIGVGNIVTMLSATTLIAVFQLLFIPPLYALTYVNTWIFLTDILVQTFKPKTRNRDWGDTLLSLMLIILLLEPILEATRCSNLLENLGGHALFDSWIVIYLYASLAVAYYRKTSQSKLKSW